MKFKMPIIPTAVAMIFGLIVLFYYFFPSPQNEFFRLLLLQWAITLSAVALLVGVFNMLSVHLRKTAIGGTQGVYSGLLIFSLVATFVIVFLAGPDHPASRWIFANIQIPVETSLMGVLAISLAFASVRLLKKRLNWLSFVFLGTVVLILLGTGPFLISKTPVVGEILRDLRAWIAQVPAAAGARGILLGVALGTVATGLRILMGVDRPYGG